ncbi:MAG: RNA polymerase sigma factor [Gemmatimonadota bacterium]
MARSARVAAGTDALSPKSVAPIAQLESAPEAGDAEQRFGAILQQYGASMRRIARVYASPESETDDLYQEMQFQVWRSLPSFRAESSLGTWVYRVALNTALKHRRSERRRVIDTKDLADSDAQTHNEPRRQETILAEFVASLGAIDRSVLLLYMEGLTQQQIGEVVGMNSNAIAVRIHRVKRTFEARYTED